MVSIFVWVFTFDLSDLGYTNSSYTTASKIILPRKPHHYFRFYRGTTLVVRLKAHSHIACRAHAVPMPYRALSHTCHYAPLPCSDSAVSFMNVRMVAGNIRTASPTV